MCIGLRSKPRHIHCRTMAQEKIAELVQALTELLSQAKSEAELSQVIEMLLTPSELEGIIQRWQVMTLLCEGVPQREIMSRLGICLGKVSRGSRLLKYDNPEFAELLKRINASIQKNK